MKRILILILMILGLALLTGCSDNGNDDRETEAESDYMANLVGASSNMPTDELDDPNNENYAVVIEDPDGWLIQLNVTCDRYEVMVYEGRIYINDCWGEQTIDIIGCFSRREGLLSVFQTVNHNPISYAFVFTGDTTLTGHFQVDTYNGINITGTLIQGSLGDHHADPEVAANWQPKQAKSKDRGPLVENK